MHLVALDDNTAKVLLALIALVPSTLTAVLAFLIHRAVRTPSGQSIGAMVEQTNHLAHANTALNLGVHSAVGATTPTADVIDKIANGGALPKQGGAGG